MKQPFSQPPKENERQKGNKKDLSFLTSLPGAPNKLKFFDADLDEPESFGPAIEGCTGVFHVAFPMDLQGRETEEALTRRAVGGTLGILEASLRSKTVRRVVMTGSLASIVCGNDSKGVGHELDESSSADIEFARKFLKKQANYVISKASSERAALDFAERLGLEVVVVNPSFMCGPFLTPEVPAGIFGPLAPIFGAREGVPILSTMKIAHVDDAARAHIFLFEHPSAKGRYICVAVQLTMKEVCQFLATKYPDLYKINSKPIEGANLASISTKKLLDLGFEFKYGLDEIYDDAIQCCKERGLLC